MSKHMSWHTQPHKPRGFGNSLGGFAAKTPASPDELWAMRRRAWRDTGVVVLSPDDIPDDFARQAVVNAAERLFGPRPKPMGSKPMCPKPMCPKSMGPKPPDDKPLHHKSIDDEEGAR